ncbi:uncharacterized protein LOC107793698 [Nicotiana tabacum]|uniref:Uncharacterized protein LOC107793698 n=1 Tax=Nicotiana tabacum TaxID=4097 RepID=A0A1S4A4M2_TOBAC|nr:uncharacterized protein LOC104112594 [Nicotiana tomentosiformis]XP_016471588.1 PREDICTED: uncharacterized protein LOC107793698 [Nicotiana tabacum]
MDKMLSVHSKKGNKQSKKPVKVVYIANPMKVNTSAAEFRALVQELTGQDAKYPMIESSVGSRGTECDKNGKFKKGFYLSESLPDKDLQVVHAVDGVAPNSEAAMTDNSDLSFEDYGVGGEDFVPELLDNLPGLMASNLWYD